MADLSALLKQITIHCDLHGDTVVTVHKNTEQGPCPVCREIEAAAKLLAKRESEALAQREWKLFEAQLIGRSREQTFGTYEATQRAQTVVLEECRKFADSPTGGLWLIGPPGVGKTHLGCAIAQAVIFQRGQSAIVATARGLVRALRNTWARGATETEEEVIERFGEVDVLVLDEVGVGFGSESELTQLFDVVDRRYQMRLPTVLLSNLTAKQLKDTLGERMYDRLREGSTVLACTWASHREKGPYIAPKGAEGDS